MNHVPDDVLTAIEELGRGVLVDEPTVLDERLRSNFRICINCDRAALDTGAATITFRLEHTTPAVKLRDHGSFVCTIVDNVESSLRDWGFDPPTAYTHRTTEDGWQVYDGTLRF